MYNTSKEVAMCFFSVFETGGVKNFFDQCHSLERIKDDSFIENNI